MISQTKMTNNINEILISDCPICFNQTELVALPCNHKICNICKKNIKFNRDGDKLCPFCRDKYEHEQPVNNHNIDIVYIPNNRDNENSLKNCCMTGICGSIMIICCFLHSKPL